MSGLTIDNSAGDAANSQSGGKAAGHNTDGFDVSTTELTIQDSKIYNQDDCIAINKGSNIIFQRNYCSGGHGISIGSISTGATVSGVQILNNQIVNNDQALRIKTKADATDASVTGITFSGNTATGTKKFGVIVDQGYPTTLGTPGNGVKISNINFTGSSNNIAVTSSAQRVAVNCGTGCTGTWDWSQLTVTGGKAADSKYKYSGIKGALTCLGVQLDPGTKQRTIDTIIANQHPDGGFGGGPGQLPHLLPTYASVCALAIVGRPGENGGWDQINRQKCYDFFMRMKQPDGSFIVNKDAEVDVRGTYCLLVVAALLDILTPELVEGTSEFLRSCQTYEGGFASSSHPYYSAESDKPQVLSEVHPTLGEAHGGYTSCAIASWVLLQPYQRPEGRLFTRITWTNNLNMHSDPKINVKKLVRWAAGMQGLPIEGGGFRGRSNKLVDGCYSWWIGGLEPLLLDLLGLGSEEAETEVPSHVTEETDSENGPITLFDKTSLQRFTLVSSQVSTGGLRDKPGKSADLYHTTYNLAGYSTAQHRVYRSLVTENKLLEAWQNSQGIIQGSDEQLRKTTWARMCAWQEDEGAHFYLGGEENRVNATHPLFNLTISHARAIANYFYQQKGL
ncbi:unnamed protein product [Rhizoctonia solani]|uniref:Prenyltransferase alpha-alpha toroid domain-containing protein n=1 Tax=Rhizoctonia solani TaxID=456999 RepID=A0A8H3DWD3_9AGAM|nr:unnamed protein product [Rhizoctonia solani]